jgi:hypothetical protein
MKNISLEQYKNAIQTITEYRIQNEGFYARVKFRHDSNKVTICYYDNLESLLREVWQAGCDNNELIESCQQITREEFEANHLPF